MKNRIIALLFLLLAGPAFAAIGGAIAQSVVIEGNKVSITVLNQSEKEITGFTISLIARFADGHVEPSEVTEDYGPLTGKTLRPHQVIVETEMYSTTPRTVEASMSVAIYRDGTAEADKQEALDRTIAVRMGIAKALKLSADTINASLGDPSPAESARVRMETLLAQKDKTVDSSFLQGARDALKSAPKGHEREAMQEQATRYAKEAVSFEAYAQIRRVP